MVNNSVCAVIVTYNPDDDLIQNFAEIAKQVQQVVIVDNASRENTKNLLTQITNLYPDTKLIYNSENLGLAIALNQGVKYAIQEKYEWVLTFDQDSCPEINMVEKMLSVYKEIEKKQEIVSIVPYFLNQGVLEGKNEYFENDSKYSFVLTAITSGNLVKTEIFEKVGLFKESLFIDFIDIEFCFRIDMFGLKIIKVKNAFLHHKLGQLQSNNLFGKEVYTFNHSHIRRYYSARNSMYVYRKYFLHHPKWVLLDLRNNLYGYMNIVLFEKERLKKMLFTFLGYWDSFRGKMGKMR